MLTHWGWSKVVGVEGAKTDSAGGLPRLFRDQVKPPLNP